MNEAIRKTASGRVILPNIRKIFVPDHGYVLFDCDLSGADAQVVAWEAQDEKLMAAFAAGLDVHTLNAEDMWGSAYTSLPGDSKHGPKAKRRKEVKIGVHMTNYLGTAATLAKILNWTTQEADGFQRRWFALHPAIPAWHKRIERDLARDNTVFNAFGDSRTYFDRLDAILPEAVAWSPQCTVAIICFEGALALEAAVPQVQILLQNHDSLVFQLPKHDAFDPLVLRRVRDALHVPAPFPLPLYIPWEFTRSELSWGDCERITIL